MQPSIIRIIGVTLALLMAACLQTGIVSAEPPASFPRPLPISNQSPLAGIFGIPGAEGTDMPGRGNTRWDTNLNVASHFNRSSNQNESILLDGETARFSIQARHGITDHWNVGIEIPWIHHGGGSLDSFIINWHDFWGFPQNGRDKAPRDRIAYGYQRDGVTRLDIDSSTQGVGDITIFAQRQLSRGSDHATVLHTRIKLPTGEADKLTGSGATDISAGIEMAKEWRPGWHSMIRAGVTYLGDGDVLPELQRNWAAYGGFEVTWRALDRLALRIQFSAHTSPYRNSKLDELSEFSGLLAMGGTWYLSQNTALDLSIVEDVPNTDVVSDVTFQLRLRTRL